MRTRAGATAVWIGLVLVILTGLPVCAQGVPHESASRPELIVRLLELADEMDEPSAAKILDGLREGLAGKQVAQPDSWQTHYQRFCARNEQVAEAAILLGIVFGDATAISDSLDRISDGAAETESRRRMIGAAATAGIKGLSPRLIPLLADERLRVAAIRGLNVDPPAGLADQLLREMSSWSWDQKVESLQLLASRASTAMRLCSAVEQGQLPPTEIPRVVVRQLQTLRDPELKKRVEAIWGDSPQHQGARKTSDGSIPKSPDVRAVGDG